jgi:uncharacterized membrane protein
MAGVNPYRPPTAHVEDVSPHAADGRSFLAAGRGVDAGQGWAWIAQAWALFKRQGGTWVLVLVVAGLVVIGVSLVPLLNWILPSVLIPGLSAGVMLGCKALDDGDRLTVGHLFAGFKARGSALLLLGLAGFVLYVIAMLPMVVVLGGKFVAMMSGDPAALADMGTEFALAILITLAISVPVYMALWFAPALVALHDTPPLAALRQSFTACLKNVVPFLVYGLILFGLGVVAVIPFALGLLVLMPVFFASVYTSYRDVFFAPRA